jgi:UDP-glucose 4-epimerase
MSIMTKSCRYVLVTGGAGFIGSHLVPRLLELGYAVTVLDNLSTGKLENLQGVLEHPKFVFKRRDITDEALRNEVFEGIDSVIHLAALVDISASVADPLQNHQVNVNGTFNLLYAAIKNKVRKFVFSSSTAVYGDAKKLPIKEDLAVSPISPYAASKVAGEAYCKAFSNCYGLNTTVLRFFNVYGPRNEKSPYSGVITKFLQQALKDETLTIFGDGEQTRDFINVNDIVEALVLALEAKGEAGDTFNICTGMPISINKLIEEVQVATERDLQVIHAPARQGEIRFSYGDPSKAEAKLKFTAKVSLQEGLKLLLNS